MSGCQKNKTEIMLDRQDTVSESETQDDTQAGNDATEDLAEAKISAEAELSESVTDSRFMYLRRKKRKRELYLRQYSRRIRDLRQQMQMV